MQRCNRGHHSFSLASLAGHPFRCSVVIVLLNGLDGLSAILISISGPRGSIVIGCFAEPGPSRQVNVINRGLVGTIFAVRTRPAPSQCAPKRLFFSPSSYLHGYISPYSRLVPTATAPKPTKETLRPYRWRRRLDTSGETRLFFRTNHGRQCGWQHFALDRPVRRRRCRWRRGLLHVPV